MIPEAAVEAAARALFANTDRDPASWGRYMEAFHDRLRRMARTALEAAAPFMLASAWDEAIAAAAKRQEDIELAIYTGQTIEDGPIHNPYRPTT